MSARKKNSLNRQVRRAYRQDELAHILTLPEGEFGAEFGMTTTEVPQKPWPPAKGVPNDYYHFRDNGASVLAVAHLDTVVTPERRAPRFYATQTGPVVISGALDDRLGAYVILRLLPEMGVTCDWLLTVGEESAQSTAKFFEAPKDYDWVIEFDRGGTDVVMYQYDDAASRRLVQASGAVMGHGSFSDIAYLEHLGVKAFNWGVGYRGNYHSERGYAPLYDTFAMTAKYLRFHAQNAGTALPHRQPYEPYGPERLWGGHDSYSTRGSTADWLDCDQCQAIQAVSPDTLICAYCDSCLNCSEEADNCTCPGGPGDWTVSRDGTASRRYADEDDESGAESGECRHANYTTCGCNNGLQIAAGKAS